MNEKLNVRLGKTGVRIDGLLLLDQEKLAASFATAVDQSLAAFTGDSQVRSCKAPKVFKL